MDTLYCNLYLRYGFLFRLLCSLWSLRRRCWEGALATLFCDGLFWGCDLRLWFAFVIVGRDMGKGEDGRWRGVVLWDFHQWGTDIATIVARVLSYVWSDTSAVDEEVFEADVLDYAPVFDVRWWEWGSVGTFVIEKWTILRGESNSVMKKEIINKFKIEAHKKNASFGEKRTKLTILHHEVNNHSHTSSAELNAQPKFWYKPMSPYHCYALVFEHLWQGRWWRRSLQGIVLDSLSLCRFLRDMLSIFC